MCGKRLNDWKTIPISRRTRLTSTPRAVISSPPTTIRPASIGSSRLTQRRSVDLPEPGRADQADDLVLGEREVDPAQHLELAERLVHALEPQSRRLQAPRPVAAHASLPACCRRRSRATSQSVKRASGIVIATNSVAATR